MAKYVRLDQVTYPNGRQVHYDYGTTGAIDDIMSRLATIGDGTNTYAAYTYLGADKIVAEDYQQAQVKLDYAHNNLAGFRPLRPGDRSALDRLRREPGRDARRVYVHLRSRRQSYGSHQFAPQRLQRGPMATTTWTS